MLFCCPYICTHSAVLLSSPFTHDAVLLSSPFTQNAVLLSSPFTHNAVLLSSPFSHNAVLLSSPFTHDAVLLISPFTHNAFLLSSPFTHDAGCGGQTVGLAVGFLAARRSGSSGGAGGGRLRGGRDRAAGSTASLVQVPQDLVVDLRGDPLSLLQHFLYRLACGRCPDGSTLLTLLHLQRETHISPVYTACF